MDASWGEVWVNHYCVHRLWSCTDLICLGTQPPFQSRSSRCKKLIQVQKLDKGSWVSCGRGWKGRETLQSTCHQSSFLLMAHVEKYFVLLRSKVATHSINNFHNSLLSGFLGAHYSNSIHLAADSQMLTPAFYSLRVLSSPFLSVGLLLYFLLLLWFNPSYGLWQGDVWEVHPEGIICWLERETCTFSSSKKKC